jgi:GWxTD domain-containing protein
MKPIIRILIAGAALVIIAGSAFAQLSPEYQNWPKGPVQFIMSPDEQAKWNQIKTDADAKAFVDLFWARRDPSPGTPANEYRDAFEAAVKYADEHFGEGRRKGSLSERGRILILLGAPTRIERMGGSTSSMGLPDATTRPTSEQQIPTQIWVYEAGKSPVLGNQSLRVPFADQFLNNTWTLQRGGGIDVADLTRRAIQATVVNPNLTEVPKPQGTMPAASPQQQTGPSMTPAPASIGEFKTESLKTAVEQFKTAKTNPYKSAGITYTELLSPTGDYYVPLQLYVPKSAGLTAEQITTFFGKIEDASGNVVAVFEEPATLSTSSGDLYFDRSLTNLKAGTYKATLGLSGKDNKPVVMTSETIELKPLAKEQSGISRLVLASDVHQTDTAALAGAPYAFGRVKIVPKGDHLFSNKDEITYFVEVVNPGIDPATNMPKLQVKLELVGAGTKDKPGRTISAPITDATPLPLTGAPGAGQYAIMAGIPLGEMKTPLPAGDYTLRVKVYDQVSKQSWTAEQPLKLAAIPPTAPPAPAPAATTTSGK